MYFISIVTKKDCGDFTNWIEGKRKRFNDSMEFSEWIERYKEFPLQIYLDGVIYTFKERKEAAFWLAGFEAAVNITYD